MIQTEVFASIEGEDDCEDEYEGNGECEYEL
jgi:hypothetical protein